MRTRLHIFLLLILFIFGQISTNAQEQIWPPDTSQIFAEGVEVVTAEIIEQPLNIRPTADDQQRIVQIYDQNTASWTSFPYPDELVTVSSIAIRSDGTLLLNQPYTQPEENVPDMWILNPSSGEFSRAEIVCEWRAKSLAGEGIWTIVTSESTGESRVCFTETGELGDVLPKEEGFRYSKVTDRSPNREWLLLISKSYQPEEGLQVYRFYGYETAIGKVNFLGSAPISNWDAGSVGIGYWVSETKGFFRYGPPQESLSKTYYAFDVSRLGSLQLITHGWLYDFYLEPPRYEYSTTRSFLEWKTGSYISEDTPCTFWLYDATGVYQQELGLDCSFNRVLRLSGSTYVYVHTYSGMTEHAILGSMDVYTGQYDELTSGPIVYLHSVSPDGRYIVLIMDGDKQLRWDFYTDLFTWENYPNGYIAVFDTVTREFVYQSRVFAPPTTFVPMAGRFYIADWCGDDCLLVSSEYWHSLSRITFEEGGVTQQSVNGIEVGNRDSVYPQTNLSPDKERLMFANSLINFDTKTVTLLINASTEQEYGLTLAWHDNTLITVELRPRNRISETEIVFARYLIRVPESN